MRIVTRIAKGVGLVFALWLGFFLIFVHPNPSRVDDPLAQLDGATKVSGRESVAIDLIDRLPDALVDLPRLAEGRAQLSSLESITNYPYAPAGAPHDVPLSVTQGKHAMLLEQRNAIYMPTDGSVAYDVEIPDGAKLSFALSILSRLNEKESPPVTFTVTIGDGEVVDEATLEPEPLFPHSETEFWYHTVGKFVTIDADFFNGKWYDRSVDLTPWAGEEGTSHVRIESRRRFVGPRFRRNTGDSYPRQRAGETERRRLRSRHVAGGLRRRHQPRRRRRHSCHRQRRRAGG